MALQLYPYQQECLDHAKRKNTIVNLDTGRGKTLIAARLIDHFLQLHPKKKVAFFVPTRPLVEQQAEYIAKHCRVSGSTPVVQRLVGQDQAGWRQSDWDECIQTSHILLGTAALFQQAFVTYKYVGVASFSLLVFDECHNAVGNSPMAAVMRDGVAPHAARGLVSPRILGLTASFVNGSLQNMETQRRKLEALLNSTIICPHVAPRLADDKFKFVLWKRMQNVEHQKQALAKHVEEAVKHVGEIKEVKKVVTRCLHVFEELGSEGLLFYIEKVIVQQILDKVNLLKEQDDEACIRYAEKLMRGLSVLVEDLTTMAHNLESDPLLKQAMPKSWKLKRLIELVAELFAERPQGYRGIIFMEQVALVSSLAQQLNSALAASGIQCGAVAGGSHQNDNDRQHQLDKFKCGELQILVATATLEEGIDVSECAFVIRYTYVATTKAHIQGAGRARHPQAVIYYFENNPLAEREKEAAMKATANDTSLSLDSHELDRAIASMSACVEQSHPYPFGGVTYGDNNWREGEVNVFNCKKVLNEYCSITLGASIQPKHHLYQYTHLPGQQKILSRVRFPTPGGWKSITQDSCKEFWTGVDLDQVLVADRVKNKSASDKEEMLFVYLVVVELRQNGYLNRHNVPDPSIRFDTKRSCPLHSDWSAAIRIKNKVCQTNTTTHAPPHA